MVPSTTGGTAQVTFPRSSSPYDRARRFDELDPGRVGGPGASLCGRVLGRHGPRDSARPAPAGATLYHLCALSPADPGRSSPGDAGLPQAASPASAPWPLGRPAPIPSAPMVARLAPGGAERLTALRRGPVAQWCSLAPPSGRGGGAVVLGGRRVRRRPGGPASCRPPLCHNGPERALPRPPDAPAQQTG